MTTAVATVRVAVAVLVALLVGCTNDPYPAADDTKKIVYVPFETPTKTLDPAVAYTTVDHAVTGPVYDTLLEYHYLDRPYRLIPGLARELPEREIRGDRIVYRFQLRAGLTFQPDPCFSETGDPTATREIEAADVAFQLMRMADPAVNSPVMSNFVRIEGLSDFTERLTAQREADAAFAARPVHEQYASVGGITGVRTPTRYDLEIVLTEPHPQLLYWFAMEFTTPVPWEAVEYYDGRRGREAFAEHPVGSGPFRVSLYDKRHRIVLERFEDWYGRRHPEWLAPAAVYPGTGEPGDVEAGVLDPAYVGKPLPFIERVELRFEKDPIPTFNKFLQGYYDLTGVVQESFDSVVKDDRLSEDMAARGMQLSKTVIPTIYYLGFNMDDPVVGVEAGARGRALRQAMSLAIDAQEYMRIFQNGRGVAAQTPLPPGLYGYDETYRNPFREVDLGRARALLVEAGYPGGLDPETGRPLHLSFDTGDTSARARLRYQFFVDAWRALGLDVRIAATTYNQWQDKARRGAYQLFMWGWVADYPDPENFFFLLSSEMARSGGGPNTANFRNADYDALFARMRNMENGPERLDLIRRMRVILETERPWIELFHVETFILQHGWMRNVKPLGMSFSILKYEDVDPVRRAQRRAEWNRPVLWPLYVLAGVTVLLLVPAVVTFLRERQ